MKCIFCHQDCILYNNKIPSIVDWKCNNHPEVEVLLRTSAEVEQLPTDKWYVVMLTFDWKNGRYAATSFHNIDEWDSHLDKYTDWHPKFRLDKLKQNDELIEETVFDLDFMPDVTPENVRTRIPTLVTFS